MAQIISSLCSGFSLVEHRLRGAWGSVVRARGLRRCSSQALEHRLSSCGAWTELLHGMWNLPGPGIEPVSLYWQADSYPLYH